MLKKETLRIPELELQMEFLFNSRTLYITYVIFIHNFHCKKGIENLNTKIISTPTLLFYQMPLQRMSHSWLTRRMSSFLSLRTFKIVVKVCLHVYISVRLRNLAFAIGTCFG